jgi:cytochrome c oxidase cbb3-type subunit III
MPLLRSSVFLAAAALLAAGCQAKATPTPTPSQALYTKYCAVCHGPDGKSVPGMLSTPYLDLQPFLTIADDTFIRENTARGRPGENGRGKPGTKMSAFGQAYGGPLTDAELNQLVAFIRAWQTEPSVTLPEFTARGDAVKGAKMYTEKCESCHGKGGWPPTNLAPALAGETLQATASDAFLRHTVLNGRLGTTMPAFALTDTEIEDLVTYVRSFYKPPSADGS